jgi:hypothetical protein
LKTITLTALKEAFPFGGMFETGVKKLFLPVLFGKY